MLSLDIRRWQGGRRARPSGHLRQQAGLWRSCPARTPWLRERPAMSTSPTTMGPTARLRSPARQPRGGAPGRVRPPVVFMPGWPSSGRRDGRFGV